MTPMQGVNPPESKDREIHRAGGIKLPQNRRQPIHFQKPNASAFRRLNKLEATRPDFIIPASKSVTRLLAERKYQHKPHQVSVHKFGVSKEGRKP
jgi:hypothetical protein